MVAEIINFFLEMNSDPKIPKFFDDSSKSWIEIKEKRNRSQGFKLRTGMQIDQKKYRFWN